MVGRLLQNSTLLYLYARIYIYVQQLIFIQLQPRHCSFNSNIHSTSTQVIFVQQEYLFNFDKNVYSISTQIIFVQQEYLFNFNMNYFHSRKIFIQLFTSSRTSINLYSTKSSLPYPSAAPLKKSLAWKQHVFCAKEQHGGQRLCTGNPGSVFAK